MEHLLVYLISLLYFYLIFLTYLLLTFSLRIGLLLFEREVCKRRPNLGFLVELILCYHIFVFLMHDCLHCIRFSYCWPKFVVYFCDCFSWFWFCFPLY